MLVVGDSASARASPKSSRPYFERRDAAHVPLGQRSKGSDYTRRGVPVGPTSPKIFFNKDKEK